MAQLKTIVGIYCTGSYMTFQGQAVAISKARVAGLMLYDPGSQRITLEQINNVGAMLKSNRLIIDNIDLHASQEFSPNLKNPTMSIPASPVGCTTCPIDMLPCYSEQNQQPRERYVVARIVSGGKTIGYRISQGFQVKEFKLEDILGALQAGTITLCNAKVVENKYLAGKYAPIPDIDLARVQAENKMRPILANAMRMQPITMQEAQAQGYILRQGNSVQVTRPFLLNRGHNDIELITPYTQEDMNVYRANQRKIPVHNAQPIQGRQVVRSY